jgi:hypothetical protein
MSSQALATAGAMGPTTDRTLDRPKADLNVADSPTAIEAASRRLMQALDALDGAVERRQEADKGGEAREAQLHALGADRARLASELDAIAARARQLEGTNREVARRIEVAMDTVRTVIENNER